MVARLECALLLKNDEVGELPLLLNEHVFPTIERLRVEIQFLITISDRIYE